MVRLRLVRCHEPRDAMTEVPGGRHCHRCQLTVLDLSEHGEAELAALRAGGRVCGSIETRRAGAAAAAIVAATVASGCAPWADESWESGDPETCEVIDPSRHAGVHARTQRTRGERAGTAALVGTITDMGEAPIHGAVVVIMSESLDDPREVKTDALGRYRAPELPPGRYIVDVSYGLGRVSKAVELRDGDTLRLDLQVEDEEFLLGLLIEDSE